MQRVKKSPQEDFFSRRLEGSETPFYTVRIHGYLGWHYSFTPNRYLDFPEEIASAMQLGAGTSVKLECKGNLLVITPLSEATITTKVQTNGRYFSTTGPIDMLFASGLKVGDYVSLKIEKVREPRGNLEVCLRVKKAKEAGQDVVKITGVEKENRINIPVVIADDLKLDAEKVKKGMWILWTFDKKGLLGKFQSEDPHIETIGQYSRYNTRHLSVNISLGLAEWIRKNEDVILQVENGKIHVTPKKV